MIQPHDIPFKIPGYQARRLRSEDTAILQTLLENCSDYSLLVTGSPPTSSAATSLLVDCPEGKTSNDKLVLGLFTERQDLAGVLDVIRDYPAQGDWWMGLLLLAPAYRGQGLGQRIYHAFECWVVGQGARGIYLGVIEQNQRAYRFWQNAGFEPVERQPTRHFGQTEHVVITMAHPLPDPALEQLKERAWKEVAEINQALAEGQINEDEWHAAMTVLIKPAYLAAEGPYAQAGHEGDATTWEASRGFIAAALHKSGAFLDAGCANGILMESVQRWGAARGLTIEPYGLDIVPEFVEFARRRLPLWADRIFVGNIRTWQPAGKRFDYVMLRPEYAPPNRRIDMVRHVIEHVLKPGGRLIFFVGTEEIGVRSVEDSLMEHGFIVGGRVEVPHPRDSRVVRRLFWIDS
jgi:RimJ/RimL family protein N-acetyltransferase/SAM-dependent methyltransferase